MFWAWSIIREDTPQVHLIWKAPWFQGQIFFWLYIKLRMLSLDPLFSEAHNFSSRLLQQNCLLFFPEVNTTQPTHIVDYCIWTNQVPLLRAFSCSLAALIVLMNCSRNSSSDAYVRFGYVQPIISTLNMNSTISNYILLVLKYVTISLILMKDGFGNVVVAILSMRKTKEDK